MKELQCVAGLKIHHGKLDEFKRLAAKSAELVRRKDTGTLQYELYFNRDNTECLAFEGDTMAAICQNAQGPGKYAERLIQN